MIPEDGSPDEFKRCVLLMCTRIPHPGEMYVLGRHDIRWLVRRVAKGTVHFEKLVAKKAPDFYVYTMPYTQWELMVRNDSIKLQRNDP